MKENPDYQIAIIGVGPKGLYSLERILAQIDHHNFNLPVTIHLFNKTIYFGAGDIYRPDQPDYLMMNFDDGKIDIQPKDAPPPITNLQNYEDWISSVEPITQQSQKNHFSSRATVGKYYIDGFNRLLQNQPNNVVIRKHVGEVIDVVLNDNGYLITYKAKDGIYSLSQTFHKIMITTGHAGNNPRASNLSNATNFIDYLYPVDEKVSRIKAYSKVGIKGMGLTFIDAVLALTEGRGGTFEDYGNRLRYHASGEEPKLIYPFSRSGLPMIPKTGKNISQELRYFTRNKISLLKDPQTNKYNFEEDLLPEIIKEFTYQYYRQLFQQFGGMLDFHESFEMINQQIRTFHKNHPLVPGFTFHRLINPIQEPYSHQAVECYLNELITEFSLEKVSPLSAAVAVWNDISQLFNELYSFGGLDAHSHEIFDKRYFGLFNRISYGPPIQNMKKILALTEAGLIDFSFGKSPMTHFFQSDKFKIRNTFRGNAVTEELDYLIDARIPKTHLEYSSELFQNLKRREIVLPYQNVERGYSYAPGCIEINRYGHPVTKTKTEINNITLYGSPTEGITFDNDTLSRNRNNLASLWARETIRDVIKYYAREMTRI